MVWSTFFRWWKQRSHQSMKKELYDCSEASTAAGWAPPLRKVDPPVHERGVVGLPRAPPLLWSTDLVRGWRTLHFNSITVAGCGGGVAIGDCYICTKSWVVIVPLSDIAAFTHSPSIIYTRERMRKSPILQCFCGVSILRERMRNPWSQFQVDEWWISVFICWATVRCRPKD